VLQRNWEKEQNFGFYVSNECRVFAEETVFECFRVIGGVETINKDGVRVGSRWWNVNEERISMAARSIRISWLGMVCAGVLAVGVEARAQSASSAAQSAQSAANYQNMTMGMGAMAMPGMFGSPTPSAADAAALGMGGGSGGGMMGMGGNTMGNPFMNPMAAPFLYGSMLPATQQSTTGSMGMTQQQMGLMLLAGQAQMMGIGSGQLSGVRPGGMAAGGVRARQRGTVTGVRGTTRQPGGLAARYFNRTSQRPRIPQGFYNRPNQHYPQAGR
jgi:hypothetical protein